ncbi:MAG: hypothetical protein AB1778_07570 [Candidatus Bipolaricaulota bacterium]
MSRIGQRGGELASGRAKRVREAKILEGLVDAGGEERGNFRMEDFWRIFVRPVYQDRRMGQEAMRQIYRLQPNVRR